MVSAHLVLVKHPDLSFVRRPWYSVPIIVKYHPFILKIMVIGLQYNGIGWQDLNFLMPQDSLSTFLVFDTSTSRFLEK